MYDPVLNKETLLLARCLLWYNMIYKVENLKCCFSSNVREMAMKNKSCYSITIQLVCQLLWQRKGTRKMVALVLLR